MNKIAILSLAWAGLSIGGSLPAADKPTPPASVTADINAFGFDLYGKLKAQEGNLCVSPYSIATALAMASAGARGETEKQMSHALHFAMTSERLRPALAEAASRLNAIQQSGEIQLKVANSLWPRVGAPLLPSYLEICQKFYHASITPLDFRADSEGARQTINQWVETRTEHKIVEALKPNVLDRDTSLVLVNAIYFKGSWRKRFNAKGTKDEPFSVSLEKKSTVPMMQETGEFEYSEPYGLQVLELPYLGGDLSMLVLLPREIGGLAELESHLTVENLTSWTAKMEKRQVELAFPKFKATLGIELTSSLEALGVIDAFSRGRADFSGMDGQKDLSINSVEHKAFVQVSEEGTEAAAATAERFVGTTAIRVNPKPIVVFRADHPYLFLIRDQSSGAIFFLGRVMDPSQAD